MRKIMLAAALAAGVGSAPSFAQTDIGNSQGLVNVVIGVDDISILNNFLNQSQISILDNMNVPITVQVPISVAANVCGTTVAILAVDRKTGDNTCNATSANRFLAQQVVRQVLNQNRGGN